MRLKVWSLCGAVMLASCAHRDLGSAPPGLRNIDHPAWVSAGSGAFGEGDGRTFHGVGSVHGIRNPSLARTTADNRARAEIAKIFTTYSATLMRDYSASTLASGVPGGAAKAPVAPAAGTTAAGHEEQDVEQAIKTFSAATLSGVQVVDHWYHPTDGSVFALARLDLAAFTEGLERMQELSAAMRQFVRSHAEAAHQALEKAEDHSTPPPMQEP